MTIQNLHLYESFVALITRQDLVWLSHQIAVAYLLDFAAAQVGLHSPVAEQHQLAADFQGTWRRIDRCNSFPPGRDQAPCVSWKRIL
mmetsp:Transcript_22665/g.47285  ORF Transcript_22665/g.47285 Transcript_22665/m.47285 type:complete len:87 (+) Transcript_22665:2174-2434(+)